MKKLQLKKNIVAQLGKSQMDQVLGGGTVPPTVSDQVRQTLEDTSIACVSGPCHTSQITNCNCATRNNCISNLVC